MTRLRVFIATTEGPSEIQSLIEEDPDIRSVVCLNGTTESLPISKGYDAFVRKPTGVIERLTGHRVYRMDVSHPITNGNSWQLGAYLAHWLQSQGRLAQRGEAADGVVIATGIVNARDLAVEPVGHIPEKLEAAAELMREAAAQGLPVIVLAPEGEEAPQTATEIQWIGSVDQATGLLAGAHKGRTVKEIPERKPSAVVAGAGLGEFSKLRIVALVAALIAAALALAGFTLWQNGPREWDRLAAEGRLVSLHHALDRAKWPALAEFYRSYRFAALDPAEDLRLAVVGEYPADGGRCAGMRFRETASKAELLGQSGTDGELAIAEPVPCRLFFELENLSPQTRHIWLGVSPSMAETRFRGVDERRSNAHQVVAPGESIRVDLRVPLYRQARLDYHVRAAAFGVDSDEVAALVAGSKGETREILQLLENYGVSVLNFTAVIGK